MDNENFGKHNTGCKKKVRKGSPSKMNQDEFEALALKERVILIQELIPLGLMAVAKELNTEVSQLLNGHYPEDSDQKAYRHGHNPGTVRLGGRMVPIKVPRVRSKEGEIKLKSYEMFHGHTELESSSILRKVITGVSTRDVESILPDSVGSIGTSKSSISRKFIDASTKHLKEFNERELEEWPIIAIFIDGTAFAQDQMIIALGVCVDGSKRVLGFVQTATENSKPISHMLRSLLDRGLQYPFGLLAIIDGSKGLRKAVVDVFGQSALIQRCQWHKRENVASYLPKGDQIPFKKRLQKAYEKPIYKEALAAIKVISNELSNCNIAAQKSLEEGLLETLTLHKIDMFALFSISLKTTNCIESLNARVKNRCKSVKRWKNSSQKERWLATALLEVEKGFKKIKGCKNMDRLCAAVAKETKKS